MNRVNKHPKITVQFHDRLSPLVKTLLTRSFTGASINEINNLQLDLARSFLQQIYPSNSEFRHWFNVLYRDRVFWNWWFHKWDQAERSFMTSLLGRQLSKSQAKEMWRSNMYNHINDPELEKSFQEFLKTLNIPA